MSNFKTLTGINIQWPWSEYLLKGLKTIETRSYKLPESLKNVELAIIETPGSSGKKLAGILKARIIGTIIFEDSFEYKTKKQWLSDYSRHLVEPDNRLFAYSTKNEKWGWIVKSTIRLDRSVPPPTKRGIILAKNCKVPKVQ